MKRDANQTAKGIVDLVISAEAQGVSARDLQDGTPMEEAPLKNAAAELGRRGGLKGGKARAASMTPEERKRIATEAAIRRWEKNADSIPRAQCVGTLRIGELAFPCSVLSDGTRILTQSDFMEGMGMYYSGWIAKHGAGSAELPHFLAFKALEEFIPKHLGDVQSIVVKYRTETGGVAHGIRAEIIPLICEVWMDADERGKLGSRQKAIAANAKIIIRALARVGIIALVDEATGYQYVRTKIALAEIFERYIAKDLGRWAKTFPDEYYQHLFRLRGWDVSVALTNRPQVVGHFTNDIVYRRLAPHILEELRRKNPVKEAGRRSHRHHQWLTPDFGHPKLREHFAGVMALMRISKTWAGFMGKLDAAYPRFGEMPDLFPELGTEDD